MLGDTPSTWPRPFPMTLCHKVLDNHKAYR